MAATRSSGASAATQVGRSAQPIATPKLYRSHEASCPRAARIEHSSTVSVIRRLPASARNSLQVKYDHGFWRADGDGKTLFWIAAAQAYGPGDVPQRRRRPATDAFAPRVPYDDCRSWFLGGNAPDGSRPVRITTTIIIPVYFAAGGITTMIVRRRARRECRRHAEAADKSAPGGQPAALNSSGAVRHRAVAAAPFGIIERAVGGLDQAAADWPGCRHQRIDADADGHKPARRFGMRHQQLLDRPAHFFGQARSPARYRAPATAPRIPRRHSGRQHGLLGQPATSVSPTARRQASPCTWP